MDKIIIAAIDLDGGIGKDGKIPWHISDDLKRFKEVTVGYPVIMGRKTYESIPNHPLPDRKNIVLSRHDNISSKALFVKSLDLAFILSKPSDYCFIIGGAKVYKSAIEVADELYITRVHTHSGADVFFPKIDERIWEVVNYPKLETDPESGLQYEFLLFNRRVPLINPIINNLESNIQQTFLYYDYWKDKDSEYAENYRKELENLKTKCSPRLKKKYFNE